MFPLLTAFALSTQAQVYQTQADFRNTVQSGASANSAFATPVNGYTFSSTNRPAEAGTARFKIDHWSSGMPFSSSPPDFNFGDVITPPPLTDLSKAPTVVTTNGAFYMAARQQLIAAQGGACTVNWPTLSGGTNTVTYTLGSVPTIGASRLFWTDNYVPGGRNTNLTSVPDNSDYAVSLSGVYAKIHYNQAVPDFDPADSQDTPGGQTSRQNNASTYLDLSAVWIDGNDVLRARNQSGYFIVEYFDTSGYANSVAYEVVYVGAARVYQSSIVLGDRLLPSEGATAAAGLKPSTSKAGSYVTQWSASGSHFQGWIFAVQVNSDSAHPDGDPSKTQVVWQRTGNLQVVWPYEPHWYAITWPGDGVASLFVYDPSNPAGSPAAMIPTNYTATVVWSESPDKVLTADSSKSQITAVGEGRALIQYQNSTDVWFVPVRVASRTNGAYFSNQEIFWPVGSPVQPVETQTRMQFDGAGNYLSFSAALQPDLTIEMWINPTSISSNQTLIDFLDYPQQATIQAALSLTNGRLQLAILTNGVANTMILVSTNTLPAGSWSHVAFTKHSSGKVQLFVNGVGDQKSTISIFNAQVPGNATFAQVMVGKNSPVNGSVQTALPAFAGEIRELRMWDAVLSSTTILADMSADLTGAESSLAHLIKPIWEESHTPADGSDGTTYLVPDLATGELVSGYGIPNTTGQSPFPLANRLSFDGLLNWAEIPLTWNRLDDRTVEFWLLPATVTGSNSLFAIATTGVTNVQIALVNGHLTLATNGGSQLTGSLALQQDTAYQVAITTSNGTVSLYVDATLQGSKTLPGSGSVSLGSKILLATGSPANYTKFTGDYSDLRAYSPSRSITQLNSDSTSSADESDPSLNHVYNFDQISPGTIGSEQVFLFPDTILGVSATYHGRVCFGSDLPGQSDAEETGGIVRQGTAYHSGIYSSEARIIPINSTPTNSLIEVWWDNAFTAPYLSQPLLLPSMVNRYRLMDPLAPPILVVAGQNTSGYSIPNTWDQPAVYYQNDSNGIGYNPNEEHALLVGSSVYALRWDLNQDSTSHAYVLLQYKDLNQGSRSFLQPIQVVSTNAMYPNFNRSLMVGQLLQAPKPLIDLPKSILSGPLTNADPNLRLYQDNRYDWWARSAVLSGTPDSVPTRWFYPLQPGFYWPAGLGTKVSGDPVPFGNTTNGLPINYTITWPVTPHLPLGQSLSSAIPGAGSTGGYLPAVTGQKSVEVLYDQSNSLRKTNAVLVDPSNLSSAPLNDLTGTTTPTDVQFGKTYFTLLPPHLRDRVYWDPMAKQIYLTGGIIGLGTAVPYVLPAWLSPADYTTLSGLGTGTWQTAVSKLRRTANIIPNAATPFDTLILTPTGQTGGYVTLGFNTSQTAKNEGDPVSLQPIFVDTNLLYQGAIIVLASDNKFDQYTTLRHSGDFGGDPSQFQFDWRYTSPVDGQVPTSDPSGWTPYTPVTTGLNNVVFGGPGLLTLKDNYFSCRWRCITAGTPNGGWSPWTGAAFVESWLTRAMDGINPFEQRVSSLANNHVDLTSSLLSQAGKRFVGAVPLNMDNADSFGLIETYETLLQQARNLSIDAGYSDNDVNASLLDSASKLNELYTMLGDEALSDSRDPTIAWGSRDLNDVYFGSRASSLFAFQGIVPSLLEEELALLRGLDDTTSTPVTTYPVYNRLYWNFTKGISSGEPAYALNYNIPSVVDNAMGSITEADAAKLYPQGHGDAYGHYLTALKEYYRLLMNTNFTWYPRSEVKVIGGVNVTFDYVDERKMAAAAVQRGLTSMDILDLTYRRDYKLDPDQRKAVYDDSNTNRAWSAAEWADRASQGALYDWIVINSLLPTPAANDTPQTISRATVPELTQLAGLVRSFQDKSDVFDRGDSPMDVAASVVPFDLDPTLLDAGQSHFEQVYARAISAMRSAYAVLQRASATAANMRRQDVSLEAFRYQIAQRENEFNAQLVDIYGSPYSDDIGPTGAFVSGYTGADLYHYNYIDRDLFDPATAGAVTNVSFYSQYSVTGTSMDTMTPVGTNITYSVNSDGIPVLPNVWTGHRSVYGKVQGALGDYIRAWVNVRGAIAEQTSLSQQLEAHLQRLRDHNAYSASYGAIGDSLSSQQNDANMLQELSDNVAAYLADQKAAAKETADALAEATPKSVIVGLADGGDLSFPARLGIELGKIAEYIGFTSAEGIANLSSYAATKTSSMLGDQIAANDAALQDAEYQSQTALETTVLLSRLNATKDSVYASVVTFRQAWQAYTTLVSKGNQLQMDVAAFRASNAARIQEARYADVIFRTFRNEDLEQYRNAFDQAARYAYAAARVYDYETGLLDPNVVSGQSGDFMGDIMAARQLGDMVDGLPVPGSSEAHSLADVLDRMSANWSAIKGRFSINNPTLETHSISLRQELFRIGNSTNQADEDANDTAWQNQLYLYKVSDIRQVPEFKNFCQAYSPMATSEPALVIPFSTEITASKNVFGLPLAGGDTVFDPAHFTTKIRGATITFGNYTTALGSTATKTPRVYLVPVGIDRQRTPLSGGTEVRDWQVVDQVWPIPYPSAADNASQPLPSTGTDNVHVIRRFPPMRAYDDTELSHASSITYDSRLVGRSVWNTRWVLIIPASSLSADTGNALNKFVEGVTDIKLLLKTYSYSGN